MSGRQAIAVIYVISHLSISSHINLSSFFVLRGLKANALTTHDILEILWSNGDFYMHGGSQQISWLLVEFCGWAPLD